MSRRNKKETEEMRGLVNYYLMQNNNNPHNAYDEYIKDYLLNNMPLPYFINGLKDFIKLSQDEKHNQLLMVKIEKQLQEEKENQDNYFKDMLNNITFEQVKEIWVKLKDIISDSEKQSLGYLYISKANNEFSVKDLSMRQLCELKNIIPIK